MSLDSFVFRVVAGVVNGAACAVNHFVQVISPVDIGHIWDEPAVGSCTETFTAFASTEFPHTYFCELPHGHAGRHKDGGCEWTELAAPADPHPAGAADPAGGTPPPPAGSPLTWEAWSIPAILDCLAEHLALVGADGHIYCYSDGEGVSSHGRFEDWELWREHVAPELAARIGCDPTRAVLALTSLQTQ